MSSTPSKSTTQLQLVSGEQPRCAPSAAGSDARFAELVRRHEHAMYRRALRLLRCEQDALDCTQEALIAAWRSGAAWRDADIPVRAWLLRITERRAIDFIRKQRRDQHAAADAEVIELITAPGDAFEQLESRAETIDALSAIRAEFRGVALLRLVYDLSEADTAQRLGLPLNTVKSRFHRARRDLSALLSPGACAGAAA
jgi:RNA polymerase sigma-70 factor (ECF subfamily)